MSGSLVSVISTRRFGLVTVIMSGLIASIATVGIVKQLYHLSRQYIIISRRPVPITLSHLPLELQIQILSLLEWDDILRVRQTSKRVRDASLSRPVWLALVKWYSATVFPQPFCLEKPLHVYTGRELEHLVLCWKKARHCWALDQYKNIPIQRRFLTPEKARKSVHLVEGGRWLLVGTESGSVLYYDLNASGIEPSILIPSPFDEETSFKKVVRPEVLLSVDMDLQADYLTFNLGIMTMRMPSTDPDPSQPPRFFRWIQVWRVNSNVDEDGNVKGLWAERLACFPEQHRNRCDSFRLQDQRVAYALKTKYEFSDTRDGPCLIVVDWTLRNSSSLDYPRKVVWRMGAEWLALLPENTILCYCFRDFFLFDLEDASLTTLDPSNYHRHMTAFEPLAKLALIAEAISRPYFLDHSSRISVLTMHGVGGIVIHHANGTSRSTMEGIKLFSTPFLDTQYASIGYDRALICSWPELITLQYAWPEDSPRASVLAKKAIDLTTVNEPDQPRWPEVLFDESSDRILLSCYDTDEELLLGIGSLYLI